jgi:Uma2 family endonuclease
MHMQHATKRWTVDDLAALPDDGRRWELIDGVLYADGEEVGGDPRVFRPSTPAPELSHQRMLGALYVALRGYLAAERVGEVILGPLEIHLSESPVEPDLVVLPLDAGALAASVAAAGLPLLVVEVVLSATARADRFTKRVIYQRSGVPEYWIVDLDARAIERWQPGDERPTWLGERVEWRPAGATEPLVIEFETLFRDALGEIP